MRGLTCVVFVGLVSSVFAGTIVKREDKQEESDQEPSDSVVHYDYGRHYGYGRSHYGAIDPYHVPVVPVPIPVQHVAPAYGLGVQGYGYHHKHGYHADNGLYSDYGYEREIKHGHNVHVPVYSGYVPTYGHTHGLHDHAEGYAIGHDALGPFDHYTGAFGPFGFYANFYHD